jgi:hypothetical protein
LGTEIARFVAKLVEESLTRKKLKVIFEILNQVETDLPIHKIRRINKFYKKGIKEIML